MGNMFEDSRDKEVIKDMSRGAALGGGFRCCSWGIKRSK